MDLVHQTVPLASIDAVCQLELYDRRQAVVIRAWKEGPLETRFRGRFVDVDLEIAERCAALRVPNPRPEVDALIAATAIIKRGSRW